MREIINLNYNWLFNKNYHDNHIKDFKNLEGFIKVDLPHNAVDIPLHYFNESDLNIDCTYKKEIFIKDDYYGKKLFLNFEGVSNIAHIFINDEFVKTNKGAFNSFKVDITDFVNYGTINMLTVYVDSHENVMVPPFGSSIDFLTYSGIYREVQLEILDKSHIVNHFIRTYNPVASSLVTVGLELTNQSGTLEITILDDEEKLSSLEVKVTNMNMDINVDLGEKKILWSLDNPFLYNINIKLYEDNVLKDEINSKFGIRSAIFKSDGFYLNNEKIKLVGLNRHQSYPYVGYAMPKSAQQEDADILKYELGLNIVRTSHYPQSKHFLDRCDEIGLLVLEEIPGWGYIGNDEYKELTYSNLKNMIIKDRNHPSIILWGTRISGTSDNDVFYKNTNTIAKNLDDTRQTTGSRNIIKSKLYEDVFSYNDYSYNHNKAILNKSQVTKTKHPYLITEYAGKTIPTKRFDDEGHRFKQAYRHLNIMNKVLDKHNNIAGGIGWSMNDYNTHQEFGAGDQISYNGVLDIFRLPKLSSFVYSSQKDTDIVMELSSSLNNGDYLGGFVDRIYAFTNCDFIKLYRNNEYVKTFYPCKKKFKNLKHPPIIIDDFIGQLLEKHDNIKKHDSKRVKQILYKIARNKGIISTINKLEIWLLLNKYHLTYTQATSLYHKYLGGWRMKDLVFRFDGYKNGEKVKTIIRDNNRSYNLTLDINKKVLRPSSTYDVAKVVVKKVNQNDEVMLYSFDRLDVETSGPIEIIGPSNINLIGGEIAFWIKTTGEKGVGTITISSKEKLIETVIIE